MRVLMLAFAWAITACPVSGQLQQEILQRADGANVSIQTRVGSMYDLGRDVPQNDTEDGSWKRILIGAGVGLTVGFVIGWEKDFPGDQIFSYWTAHELQCVHSPDDIHGPCLGTDKTVRYRIAGSLAGLGLGAAIGWLWPFGDDNPD